MINEKFVEDSDPIRDMGIGMNKETISKLIQEKINQLDEDEEEKIVNIVDNLAVNRGAAFDMYFSHKQKLNFYFLRQIVGDSNIKIKHINLDEDKIPPSLEDSDWREIYDYLYTAKIEPLLKGGWEIFWQEKNFDFYEFILVKYKSKHAYVKEDMGGVSAPMSTLHNTPGMGTAVPPSTADGNSIGSGDKWGNTIGGKPYTQGGKVKKKRPKKKKTEKIEEENINPYDKIGMSMAKKMKVKPPFKKKKSSKNQNKMVQRKFEHEITPLDDFLNENYGNWDEARNNTKSFKVETRHGTSFIQGCKSCNDLVDLQGTEEYIGQELGNAQQSLMKCPRCEKFIVFDDDNWPLLQSYLRGVGEKINEAFGEREVVFTHKNNPNFKFSVFKDGQGRILEIKRLNPRIRFPFSVGQTYNRSIETWACNHDFLIDGKDPCPEKRIFGVKISDVPPGHEWRRIFPNKFR